MQDCLLVILKSWEVGKEYNNWVLWQLDNYN